MEYNVVSFVLWFLFLAIGCIVGYFARQSIAQKRAGTLEQKLQKRVQEVKKQAGDLIKESEVKAAEIIEKAQKDIDSRRKEFLKAEQVLLDRDKLLDSKAAVFDKKEAELQQKVDGLKTEKEQLDTLRLEAETKLEKVANLSREDAKKELLSLVETDYQKDILERIRKIEQTGKETYDAKAREIITLAIQKCAVPHTQEISTSTVVLEGEDMKGRIIGKEGRNIKTFERLTGVELILDETPDTVVISCFNSVRRQIAKLALEKLIQDGRIQPAKIEEKVQEATTEVSKIIKEAGEKALYDLGIVGVHEKLVQILGRLHYRTSYGQNVLLHSMEMAQIAETIAEEIGANSSVVKRAALFHDIGKALDQQIQGSHIEIGIKILEKFGEKEEIIKGMRAHHGDYPVESVEAAIVNAADAISGSRPGARKDTLENYLQRLTALESIATKLPGVEKAYAIQAGREIRVFVKSNEVDDLATLKIAREIADNIEDELKYPGEIKVTVIRENRVVEFAR